MTTINCLACRYKFPQGHTHNSFCFDCTKNKGSGAIGKFYRIKDNWSIPAVFKNLILQCEGISHSAVRDTTKLVFSTSTNQGLRRIELLPSQVYPLERTGGKTKNMWPSITGITNLTGIGKTTSASYVWVKSEKKHLKWDETIYVTDLEERFKLHRIPKARIGYIRVPKKEGVLIRRYNLSSDGHPLRPHIDETYLAGRITKKQAFTFVKNSIVTLKDMLEKGEKEPFKAQYKRLVLTKDEFDDKVTMNEFSRSRYSKENTDETLQSLKKIVEDADGDEYAGNKFSVPLKTIYGVIEKERKKYSGAFPCVEVIGIWHNFCILSQCFHASYAKNEPLLLHYMSFENPSEMIDYPL